MKVRAYLYSPPNTHGCNPEFEGTGCYNTGEIDLDAGPGLKCLNPDPKQFGSLADLIAYAASRGTPLRQFNSVEEVNAVCGESPIQQAPPPQTVTGTAATSTSGCTGGVCGPIQGPQTTVTAVPVGTSGAPNNAPNGQVQVTQQGGAARSPSSGGFGTTGSTTITSPVSGTKAQTGTTAAPAAAGFDFVAFLKGPLGILTVVLVVIVLLLTRK